MKKRLVSLILATLLIFTSIPAISVHASAATTEDGFVYSISDGEVTITAYTGSAAELTVPAEIEGCPVTSIGDYSFSNRTSLTSIDLPDSVTNIGELAFIFCSSLTSITLPDSVTSIGDWAFVGCDSLASINIPECVTCINVGTFSTCRSLTSVTIPVGVLSIGDCAFDECTGIRTVYYEGSREQWNAIRFGSSNNYLRYNNIEYLGEPKPEPVPLPEGFAYEIVDGEATVLYYVGTPAELTVPAEFEGYPVTRIGNSAFACHEDLISIELPDTVTSIGDSAFMRCFSLESINIPEGVTSIGEYAFLSCSSLKSIDIPDGVTIIGEGMFSTCSSFTSITLPDGITLIDERAFYGCDNHTSINVPDSVLSIGEDAFTGCYSLESINLLSVTSIGRYAFLGCYDLTSITISASLKTIEDYAFDECENLKTVYYVGYEKEWNAIGIGSNNESLTSAEIIFLGSEEELEPDTVLGDLNGDSEINAKDANLIKQIIAGESPVDGEALTFADLNSDGEINAKDANFMKQLIAGEIQI